MKKVKLSLLSIVMLLVAGCIPSLHSIVNDENRIVDDQILGFWTLTDEDESSWFFERAAEITFNPVSDSSGIFEGSIFRNREAVKYDIGAISMMPDGMKVTSKVELPQYVLTLKEWHEGDTITSYLIVNLTEIGKHKYMDFKPLPVEPSLTDGLFSFNYIYAHTFARYRVEGGRLFLEFIDGQYIQELIEKKRIRLKHEVINEDEIILTASTEELRAFILKYEDDELLFDDEGELENHLITDSSR